MIFVINIFYFFDFLLGVLPGQQSSPHFVIQPQMPHMAVPNVAGGNPGAGGQGQGQMQPPPQ